MVETFRFLDQEHRVVVFLKRKQRKSYVHVRIQREVRCITDETRRYHSFRIVRSQSTSDFSRISGFKPVLLIFAIYGLRRIARNN